MPAQSIEVQEDLPLTSVSHPRAVSRPHPLTPPPPTASQSLWRNARGYVRLSLRSLANHEDFLSQVCKLLVWDLKETALS